MRRVVHHHHRQPALGHASRSRNGHARRKSTREIALASALDAPDPRWLPDPIDDWESDAEVFNQYADYSRDD